MGKYMRKTKASGEVAVMEVAGALLGVRTRSRTLRERNDHKEGDFLELRSRRLEKPPPETKDAFPARRKEQASAFAAPDLEASFGDNVLDWDAMDRSTRETTPCSLIRSSETTMSTPGSATRTSNRGRTMPTPSVCRFVPSSLEMEEFFDAAEQQQRQAFRDKYNFCPVNGCPLPGRYEWARIDC